MDTKLSTNQKIQESEYSIPYHYIPEKGDDGFSQTLFWSWGMRYMAGIELVLSRLKELNFFSIIDIGCGDGRFLREVMRAFQGKRALGIDYSQSAVSLAKALNPELQYACIDIAKDEVPDYFDVATMIEVLEHIPPDEIDSFLRGVQRCIKPSGTLILTVPHKNKKVLAKHFQHFSCKSLHEIVSPHFRVEKIMPFDRLCKLTGRLSRAFGYLGNNYIITNKKLNMLLYKRVLSGCLEEQPEKRCGRLLALAKNI